MKSSADASLVEKVSEKGSYEETVEALQLKYDQPRKLYCYHVKAVNSLPAVKNNEECCERIIQDVTSHLSSLTEIGDDKLTTFIAAMQVNLMDEETSVHWANFTADTDKPPDTDTLVKFARHRLKTLSKINTKEDPQKYSTEPGESKQLSKPKEYKKKLTCHRLETREGKYNNDCPVCKEGHTIYSCPTFKGLNVGRKEEFVRENNLCYNCLSHGHPAHRCSSTTRCKECSGRHHSYLHTSSDAEDNTTGSTGRPKGAVNRLTIERTDLKEGTSFTPTVMLTVTAGGCVQAVKTLMDQGAGMKLITARLANQLKARRQPSTNDITCVKGDMEIKDQVDLVVAAMFGTEEQELEITALVMDHITSDSPADDLRAIKDSEFLHGLNLADPNRKDQPAAWKQGLLHSTEGSSRALERQTFDSPRHHFWMDDRRLNSRREDKQTVLLSFKSQEGSRRRHVEDILGAGTCAWRVDILHLR